MNSTGKKENGINIVDLFMYLLSKWKWFVLSVLLFGGLAWYKYATSPLVYYRSVMVIIKDPSNKTTTAGFDRYDNYINKVNVANEILQFRSKSLMREVVTRTKADIDYKVKKGLRQVELYTQSPVSVSFVGLGPQSYASLTVKPVDAKSVEIGFTDASGNEKNLKAALRDSVSIGHYSVVVAPTNYYESSYFGVPVYVTKHPLESVVAYYKGNFGIRQEGEESSILTLALKDNSGIRAEDMLNTLITVYNEDAIKEKNQVAINTAEFINERLLIIERDLGDVESDLESFKRSNQVVDINSAAGIYMSDSQKYGSSALELETQLRLAIYIKEYLTDPAKEVDLIPANTGIQDASIENQIAVYNNIKLRRDKLIDDSSDKNPVVQELNNSLRAMKQNIIRAVDNMIVSLEVRKKDAESREKSAQERITSIPTKQRQMLSIERQQKIKESLYLFLLNRREENALSQAMADNNARIIDEVATGGGPIAPVRNKIILLGILVGLACPAVFFLFVMFIDTKVHGRKDLEGVVTVPLLGEVPYDKDAVRKMKKSGANANAIETEDPQSIISEAFRVLRTNLLYMKKDGKPVQVITFTSFNESAGKTFVARNLALSLQRTGKKVVMLDLDIRKATLSNRFSQSRHANHGVTTFLTDYDLSVDDITVSLGEDMPDIIPVGPIAPNPAELLMGERLDSLICELRKKYDYIVADNVPVGMIADATITNRITDLTIFVIRAGNIDRRMLPEVEALYKDAKLYNMSLVLNGTDLSSLKSGYGYGYGYGYGKHKKKKFFQ